MMAMTSPSNSTLADLSRSLRRWMVSWWRIAEFALLIFSLALTPSCYTRANRHAIARQIVLACAPNLLWFCVLTSLASVILIRIVLVSAASYGLSQFALEMVVRVLVLELIPLTAALFVALRCTLPDGLELARLRASGAIAALQQQGIDPARREFLPRVLAAIFSVWLLAAVSCVTTLVLAYVTMYGFTPWAMNAYTHVVGQVFNAAVMTILGLKILFFSLTVALIPMTSSFHEDATETPGAFPYQGRRHARAAHGLADMVRLFSVILIIEVASLMGNYS